MSKVATSIGVVSNAQAINGKGHGVNEGSFMGGSQFSLGGAMRYQHGLPEDEPTPQTGQKLSEQLAMGGKASITIKTDEYGNQTSEVTNQAVRQYDGKAVGELADGLTAVTATGNSIHTLSEVKDNSRVKVNGIEMLAIDASRVGLIQRNADGSYGENALEGKLKESQPESQKVAPVVSEEASQGVQYMSTLAGSSMDGDVVDVFLATAAGQEELSAQLIDGLCHKVGSKMTREEVTKASQLVINSLVKEVRGVRADGVEVAMEKLDAMMAKGDYHLARSTVMSIFHGDRRVLNRLLS